MKWNLCVMMLTLFFCTQAKGAGFIEHVEGTPFRWKQGVPIRYHLDPGGLSGVNTRTEVNNAFTTWESVGISSGIDFVEGTDLPVDVTATNIGQYILFDENTQDFQQVTPLTVIIFDQDGSIFEELFGISQGAGILGIASPGIFDQNLVSITAGFAIINGSVSGLAQSFAATLTHEFGHLLNLSHTQINTEEAFNSGTADDVVIPTMFPILPKDPSVLTSLQPDDEFSLAFLYPNPAAFSARGTIRGKIIRRTGEGVRGVNIICRNLVDPRNEAVSWISDQEIIGDGNYFCGNLSTGSYTVEIQPITLAINVFDPAPPFIASEFFSGGNESFDPEIDSRSSISLVSVTEGATAQDTDIILNEDGRLISGETITDTIDSFFPELEYFVRVPSGARSVRFILEASTANIDLDLFGRCDNEFSLTANVTSDPIYDPNGSGEQQAEFAGVSDDGVETIELDGSSSPNLQNCTYHLLVTNLSSASTEFKLTASIDGKNPKFSIRNGIGEEFNEGAGEIVVLSRDLIAKGDDFVLQSIIITDQGNGDLARVTEAILYEDLDQNGLITEDDRVIASTTDINTQSREMLFSGFQQSFDEGVTKSYLLTYTLTQASAGGRMAYVIVLMGFLVTLLGICFKRITGFLAVFLIIFLGLSCGAKNGFHPTIESSKDVGVTGLTFGTAVKILVGNPNSVKEFFE